MYNQEKFKSYLGEIKKETIKENWKSKKNFVKYWNDYKARNDYSLIISEAKIKATKWTGLKN